MCTATAQYKKDKELNPKMSRKSKQAFLRRRHIDGQQAHNKMLGITIYQRNANQITTRYHLTPIRMAIVKISINKCWRESGEKGTFLHCLCKCKLVQSLRRTVWRFLKNLKIELLYDSAILILGIYSEKSLVQKGTFTPVFIAALFTIGRTWWQPKCPSTEDG